ncbi:MAG: molecular chaperone HtpG [Oscillospiraceae bacterium]|nr:molecular chaperone HtpG [Oscillospiraceae bacterium]
MQQQKGSVSIHAENIMPIIKKWLYSDKDIFVRELVSNGCDAITKHRLASGGQGEDYAVRVLADEKARTLRFIDNGVGMTDEEVATYINQVAFSGAESFLAQYKPGEGGEAGADTGIIGHFGLGFYSAFMVADQVTIDTRSFLPDAQPVRWTSADGMNYEMEPGDWPQRGTCVTLHLTEEEAEFAKPHRVREVLSRYCAFLSVPVYLEDAATEAPKAETEAKEGEGEAPQAPQPINDTKPLWLKSPADCTDEEYKAFYHQVFHEFEDPLFWVHLNVDYPFRLQGILYFPKLKQNFGGMEGQIKLFSGQVFVADNIKEVIPEFLMLLKGVLDCPDLPLNVSRSFLQNDSYVRRLSAHITRKVADKLTGMFAAERDTYAGYWNDIHPFVKFGCMRDEKFYERMKDALLFEKVDGGFVTLAEYLDANKEKAPDTVYYTNDASRQDAAVALYRERGIDVVRLEAAIDVNFISFLEYSGGESKVAFRRVDADVSGLTDAQGEDAQLDVAGLEALFRAATDKPELKVEAKPLAGDTLPVLLVEGEQSRRFKEMSRLYGNLSFAMPDDYTLVLNRRSPVLAALAARDAGTEDTRLIARQLYDLAALTCAPLPPDEMTAFLRRSQQVLALLCKG